MGSVELNRFLSESNRIEDVNVVTDAEMLVAAALLEESEITAQHLAEYVRVTAGPAAVLRDKPGMDVYVGAHLPPAGGVLVPRYLDDLLVIANSNMRSPYRIHCDYETLHPFMDGNGRSGRLLWLWQTLKFGECQPYALPFLQRFYYDTLAAANRPHV